jgi:hypothetical protein
MKIPLQPCCAAMRTQLTAFSRTPTLLSADRLQDISRWATIPQKVLSLSRGGGTPETLDLTRIGMRLSAMSSYAIIASLLLGSGLYLFAITPLRVESQGQMKKFEKVATAIFSVMVAINIAASLHTAIILNVMTLYANTALGQGLDEGYLRFWNAPHCQALRQSAFRSFIVAIQTFKCSFALSVFLKTNGKHRWIATGTAVAIMVLSGVQFWQMVHLASKHIFL